MIYLLLILSILPFVVPVGSKRTAATVVIGLVGGVVTAISLSVILGFELPGVGVLFDYIALSPIGAIFALLFSASFLAIMLADRTDRSKSPVLLSLFYASTVVLYISLIAILIAPTLWDFALSWELMGCSSFMLMLHGADRRESLHSAILYFIAMHVGFIFILAGFLMAGTPGYMWGGGGIDLMAWLMFFVGFGLKSAIFPLHFWLPPAYRSTSGTGAALLSGGATNIGLYGLLVITYNSASVATCGFILFCFGITGALFGAFRMIRSSTLSNVLSYSSIENLGVIVMAFGLSFYAKAEGMNTVALLAIAGGVLRMYNHAISKSLLFVAVGQLQRSITTDAISALGGLARRMPFTSTGFAVGGLSLCSMPPFAGFVSEFLIFTALFVAVGSKALSIIAIVGIVALALASASTIFNISKSFGVGFLGLARSEVARGATEHRTVSLMIGYALFFTFATVAGWVLCITMMEYSVEIFAISIDAEWIFNILIGVATTCGILVIIVGGLWALRHWATKKRPNTIAPTWGCAYDSHPAPEAQYTAESFAAEASLVVEYKNSLHSKTKAALRAQVSPMRFMRRWTARLALLQTGRTSHYVMHIILFLALVLILTITSAI